MEELDNINSMMDFDHYQNIARAAFGDMLYDTDRNQLYYKALKKEITRLHKANKEVHVLDIGTGTGLLAMMAAKCGADSVYACEEFEESFKCAKEIIRLNGFEDKIVVIPKSSQKLKIGVDIPHRLNLLVTEVFDTELIGEGALSVFNHAHKELLTDDCVVIPSEAIVYAQVVESEFIRNFNRVNDIYHKGKLFMKVPENVKKCQGIESVFDLQLGELPTELFKTLVPAQVMFRFNWSDKNGVVTDRKNAIRCKPIESGVAHAAFVWWDLAMDMDGEIILSCAPKWRYTDNRVIPWRDHWIQGVYYFTNEVHVKTNEEVNLIGYHDELSFWFDTNKSNAHVDVPFPYCECDFHRILCRTLIGLMNDHSVTNKYLTVLEKYIQPNSVCLFVGSLSFLGLSAALFGAKKVYYYDVSGPQHFRKVLKSFITVNGLENQIVLLTSYKEVIEVIEKQKNTNEEISTVFMEPSKWILPEWIDIVRYALQVNSNTFVFPKDVTLKIQAVEFDDLWKIRAPIMEVEGFEIIPFNEIVQESIKISDGILEEKPLWEYPSKALSDVNELFTLNFENIATASNLILKNTQSVTIKNEGICHGLVCWLDWSLDNEEHVSFGTFNNKENTTKWYAYARQRIYFLNNFRNVMRGEVINCDAILCKNGNLLISFCNTYDH
ncbi:protein arginine N-methyltransferase 7 [Adelges cooleyi]|uniref:protein arginine N-methyltransferase 7 n=1 Tax=Adelges cooleyi TaxID=133065 RepID=UPI00217FF88D|nr:protein arginine N-methyltransferase 7 [Adelges cooleyi]XP_050436522.1 protein arginine N-methyltransferase 7 [Adelges cooleyi]